MAALIDSPTFWVAVAFVILMALILKPVTKAVLTALDARQERIRSELDEAQRLREEAQKLLAEYKRKQRDAVKEAEDLLANAKTEAKRLSQQAQAELEAVLQRREQGALDKIAQAETQALQDVRDQAVDMAISATRTLLSDNMDAAKSGDLVDQAIKELGSKLH